MTWFVSYPTHLSSSRLGVAELQILGDSGLNALREEEDAAEVERLWRGMVEQS